MFIYNHTNHPMKILMSWIYSLLEPHAIEVYFLNHLKTLMLQNVDHILYNYCITSLWVFVSDMLLTIFQL